MSITILVLTLRKEFLVFQWIFVQLVIEFAQVEKNVSLSFRFIIIIITAHDLKMKKSQFFYYNKSSEIFELYFR